MDFCNCSNESVGKEVNTKSVGKSTCGVELTWYTCCSAYTVAFAGSPFFSVLIAVFSAEKSVIGFATSQKSTGMNRIN